MWWLVFFVLTPWVKGRKYDNLLQFNTSWLAPLGTWYYFRFCFSCSSSDYDLTLIKKIHAFHYYSFLQKFLLVTVVAEFTAKMLFKCKSFMFSDFPWNFFFFAEGNDVGVGGGTGASPCPSPFLYGPNSEQINPRWDKSDSTTWQLFSYYVDTLKIKSLIVLFLSTSIFGWSRREPASFVIINYSITYYIDISKVRRSVCERSLKKFQYRNYFWILKINAACLLNHV